jgi:hypothetical protein
VNRRSEFGNDPDSGIAKGRQRYGPVTRSPLFITLAIVDSALATPSSGQP